MVVSTEGVVHLPHGDGHRGAVREPTPVTWTDELRKRHDILEEMVRLYRGKIAVPEAGLKLKHARQEWEQSIDFLVEQAGSLCISLHELRALLDHQRRV